MSLEDIFQKKLCVCGHLNDVDEGHIDGGRCFALDFNGTIYSACDCPRFKVMSLVFRIERPTEKKNEASNSTKRTNKTIKPISTFNWGNKKNSSARI